MGSRSPVPAGSAGPLSNEIYLKNIAALWGTDPQLAWQIDDWGEPRAVEMEVSRSGLATAAARDEQGRRVYLHSRYDPVGEAGKLAEAVKLDGVQCLVIHGMGLGYHVRELFERTQGEAVLVVCEPDLDVLAAAMFTVDLSELIASQRCVFVMQAAKDYVHRRLEACAAVMMLGTQFVSHPPSERLHGAFHQSLRATLADFLSYTKMSLVTLVANARVTCRNIAYNLPAYLTTPPINRLREQFVGQPAIVISAGPSLRKNIDQLATLQSRAVLIAVQTTLKPLLARGIRPHFVTSLDFHEISRHFFEGVREEDLAHVHLVAEPKATWHVIDAYPGPMSLLDNAYARMCVGDALAARDGLRAGATVAHLSYYLAEYLGCDPIIFVGQDLAYSDNVFYSPGVAIHEIWRSELNRFCTIEMKDWEHIVRRRGILRRVKDIEGRDIYTDETLFTYLEQFEKDFAGASAKVIDATEGGARKRGAEPMPLAEAAARYCTSPLPAERLAYRREWTRRNDGRLSRAVAEISKRIEDVTVFRDRSKECLSILREMTPLTDRPAEFNRRLARVDDLRARIARQEQTYQLVSQMAPLAELRRLSADRRLGADVTAGAEKAKRQLVRDIEYVESMKEAADATLDVLEGARARLVEAERRWGSGPAAEGAA